MVKATMGKEAHAIEETSAVVLKSLDLNLLTNKSGLAFETLSSPTSSSNFNPRYYGTHHVAHRNKTLSELTPGAYNALFRVRLAFLPLSSSEKSPSLKTLMTGCGAMSQMPLSPSRIPPGAK